jgi:hypothetical protein
MDTYRPELLVEFTFSEKQRSEATPMRGVILWLLGVPISVIILLYLTAGLRRLRASSRASVHLDGVGHSFPVHSSGQVLERPFIVCWRDLACLLAHLLSGRRSLLRPTLPLMGV